MSSPRLLHQIILEQDGQRPSMLPVQSLEKKPLSFHDLSDHLKSITLQLARLGIGPGDRLALVLPNGPEMATAFLAISSVCTCAPLNPACKLEDFRSSMQALHVRALVTNPGSDHPARRAAAELGIPVIDLLPDADQAGIFLLASDLPMKRSVDMPALAGVDDVALVLQTSGTTSTPKIVPLTHRNIYYSVQNIARAYDLTPSDRCLNMMPLFHVHGLFASVAASLIAGGSTLYAPGCIPDKVLGWLSELTPTWYTAVPTIHQVILEEAHRQPDVASRVHLRFIRSSSSPLAPQLARDLETVFKAPVVEAYGMTESTHQIASNPLPPRARKLGSVGLATGTNRVAILDERGTLLPAMEIGEISIQGETVTLGYENNPAANSASFINGWLRTGDRGYMDKEGYIFIQGRLKELINRGGEKISPREVDEVLLQHPSVRQAVAFAVPHPHLGEDIAAAVVLRKDRAVTMRELRQFAASRLADFKVPRLIIFVPEIPKGPTGKIQRIGLSEKLRSELEDTMHRETSDESRPRSPVEVGIHSIWQQVFTDRPVGIHDDFLALGGDSIMAARILMMIAEQYKVNLTLSDIFNVPTIALMAKLVQERRDTNL